MKKSWNLVIVAASAFAALAVGIGAQRSTEPSSAVYASAQR